MRAGRLRHRTTIQVKTKSRGSSGQALWTWADFATKVPTGIEPLTAREMSRIDMEHDETRVRIVLRYRPIPVDAEMRIVHTLNAVTTVYEITGVINRDLRNRELMLGAKTGVNDDGG